MVDAAGTPREILEVYVRPWLRATEVVVPSRIFPDGISELSLETVAGPPGACYVHDEAGGELRVRVPAGAQVELRFARG